jgi:hypothetical protein
MINKMDPYIKQLWIEALRSGRYEQGTGVLRNTNNEYCCLGVLCDIHDDQMWKQPTENTYTYLDVEMFVPLSIQQWAGVTREGELSSAENHTLAYFNDMGSSFEKLADLIEEYL